MAQNWYYARGNQQFGPVTLDQLLGLLGTGQVQHADLVWCEGMAQWAPAGTVPELTPRPAPAPIVSAPVTSSPYGANPYAANAAANPVASNPPPQAPFGSNPAFGAAYQGSPVVNSPPWQTQAIAPGVVGYAMGPTYAGFWLRVAAAVIDWIAWIIVSAIVGGIIGGIAGGSGIRPGSSEWEGVTHLIQFATYIVLWLYMSIMESSALQASLGKLALGLKVTDMNGQRIGFGKATGRFFGKIVSGIILCIGYMMAGFTERKQALHDMMAGTLVVKRNP